MAKCTGMRCPMQHPYKVDECNNTDCPYRTEPITNAERIRAMSDEELADFITSQNRGICTDICREMYYQSNLEWLKQPAEVE